MGGGEPSRASEGGQLEPAVPEALGRREPSPRFHDHRPLEHKVVAFSGELPEAALVHTELKGRDHLRHLFRS